MCNVVYHHTTNGVNQDVVQVEVLIGKRWLYAFSIANYFFNTILLRVGKADYVLFFLTIVMFSLVLLWISAFIPVNRVSIHTIEQLLALVCI